MLDISNYDYAIFDCDGVILDSNNLKTEAYASVLEGESDECAKKFMKYHIQNGGISRYYKFRNYYEQINPVENVESCINNALFRFSEIVKEGLIKSDYIPGALEFIELAHIKGLDLFVASGSDEKELNEVFLKRGINNYFKSILGSPTTKKNNTQNIVSMSGAGKKGIFFGDARSDVEAAEDSKLDFVFVAGASLWKNGSKEVKEKGLNIITDFVDI